MKSLLAATAILFALSMPAFASQCPAMIQKAEEALKASVQDDAAKTKISEHIAKAKAEHEAGKHGESVATLEDTMNLLKM